MLVIVIVVSSRWLLDLMKLISSSVSFSKRCWGLGYGLTKYDAWPPRRLPAMAQLLLLCCWRERARTASPLYRANCASCSNVRSFLRCFQFDVLRCFEWLLKAPSYIRSSSVHLRHASINFRTAVYVSQWKSRRISPQSMRNREVHTTKWLIGSPKEMFLSKAPRSV